VAETLLILGIIGVVIILGFVGNSLFKKTMISSSLWLIIFGIIISFFGFINHQLIIGLTGIIGAIAIIGILSDGGINLDLKTVLTQGYVGWILLITGLIFSIISSVIVLLFFGFSIEIGILVGLIIAGTSSSIVIPLMISLKISEKARTILSIESIADTFSIMLAIIMMDFLSGKLQIAADNIIPLFFLEFFSAFAIGIIFGLVWTIIIPKINKNEFAYAATLGALVLVYVFAEYVGANGAITIFFSGLMLANSHLILKTLFPEKQNLILNEEIGKTHSLIVFFIRTFFFVFLGILVGFPEQEALIIGFLIVLAIILFRVGYIKCFSKIGLIKFNLSEKRLAYISIPRGLSAAILAAFLYTYNIPMADELVQIIFSIILFSIIFTTIGVFSIFRRKKNTLLKDNSLTYDKNKLIKISLPNNDFT
jgi:potassium/hydrogen antiporter